MDNIDNLMNQARRDVDLAFEIWVEILQEKYPERINYAYAKGSAVKKWDSPIDYVPILSDIDIHLSVRDPTNFLGLGSEGVDSALTLAKIYEERFITQNPNHMHIPRTQIMIIEQLKRLVDYVIPDYNHVKFFIGSKSKIGHPKIPSTDNLRDLDKNKILNEKSYIDKIPFSVFDRTGLDQWQFIRQLCWRVSPMPVRLLSQVVDNPFYLWNENRTSIVRILRENGYKSIANSYENYYNVGWELFFKNYEDTSLFGDLVRNGYAVLSEIYAVVLKMDNHS